MTDQRRNAIVNIPMDVIQKTNRNHVDDSNEEDVWENCTCTKWEWLVMVLSVIAIIMLCAMIPTSFYGVEYDEYALDRDRLYNKVDYDTVYENGNHFLGLNHETIKFPRTFQFETFSGNQLSVFSKEGLEFPFQCSFQWRVIKESIPKIHREFRLNYRPQVLNRVIATIKNTVPRFTTDDFITSRDLIDDTLSYAIQNATKDLGFDIPYDKFQLDKPLLPDNVRARFLQRQVQLVKNDEQALRQTQAIVVQQTNVLVSEINSNATRLLTEATSTSTRILAESAASAFNIIHTAEQAGLAQLFSGMNITDNATKELLRRVIALEDNQVVKLYMGLSPSPTLAV